MYGIVKNHNRQGYFKAGLDQIGEFVKELETEGRI